MSHESPQGHKSIYAKGVTLHRTNAHIQGYQRLGSLTHKRHFLRGLLHLLQSYAFAHPDLLRFFDNLLIFSQFPSQKSSSVAWPLFVLLEIIRLLGRLWQDGLLFWSGAFWRTQKNVVVFEVEVLTGLERELNFLGQASGVKQVVGQIDILKSGVSPHLDGGQFKIQSNLVDIEVFATEVMQIDNEYKPFCGFQAERYQEYSLRVHLLGLVGRRVECLANLAVEGQHELEGKHFGHLGPADQIEKPLRKAEGGVGFQSLRGIEQDIVLSGHRALDTEHFGGKGFILHQLHVALLLDFLQLQQLEHLEVVNVPIGELHALLIMIFKFDNQAGANSVAMGGVVSPALLVGLYYNQQSKQMVTSLPIHLRLLLVLPLLVLESQCQVSAKVTQSSTVAGATSSHELTVQFKNTDIAAGSYLLIKFSTYWGITSVTGGNLTSDFCETGCTIGSVGTTPDSVAMTIKLTNLFQNSISAGESRLIRYTLKNLVNPGFEWSENLEVSVNDNFGPIDSGLALVSVFAKQVGCSSMRASTTVSAYSEYQFTINASPTSIMPSNVNIMASFPSTWSSSSELGTYGNVSCSSWLNPSISCFLINGNWNVSNVLASSANAPFAFNMTNIKNPGSEEINNQLMFQFYTASRLIAYCTVPIVGTTAKSLPDLSVSLAGALGSLATTVISFSITEKPKTTDIAQIELPKEYGCDRLYTAFANLNGEPGGDQVTINVNSSLSATTLLTLQPFRPSTGFYQIKLFEIQMPKTTGTIAAIKVSILRGGALVATQSCCSASFPMLQSSQGLAVRLSTTTVGSSATHFISLNVSDALRFPNNYAYLMIVFDSKYSLSNPTYNCFMENSLSVVDPLVCTRNSSTSVMVANFNTSTRVGTGLFTIGIYSIATPITLSPLTLSLITLDANYNGIENVTTTYTLSASKINSIRVTPGLLSTYSTTFYTFMVNNTNALSIGAFAILQFPSEVQISLASLCYLNGTLLSGASCVPDLSNSSSHKMTIGLNNAAVIGSMDLSNSNITISNVFNPLSLCQSSSFAVQLVSSNGQIIEELKEGVFVTMASVSSAFNYLNLTSSNNYTMSSSNYTVQFRLLVDVIQNYGPASSFAAGGITVKVQLPSQFSCSATGTNQPCMVQGESRLLTYTMPSTSTAVVHSFVILGVVNPVLSTISSGIVVRLYLSGYLSIEETYNSVMNFEPSVIKYSLTQSNYYLGEKSKVYLTLSEVGSWWSSNSSAYLAITVPIEYSVDGSEAITCSDVSASVNKIVNGSQLSLVKIGNTSAFFNLSISIVSILNPASLPVGSKWGLELQDATTGVVMARSDGNSDVGFSLVCSLPCRSCSASNSSACTSCYTGISGIQQKYLDGNSNTCLVNCLSNQYVPLNSAELNCQICSSSCSQCANVSDNCTSCWAGSFLYSVTSKCLLSCPPEYYGDTVTGHCIGCQHPCLYCTGSGGLNCTFCKPTFLLTVYSNSTTICLSYCLAGYFNNSNICTPCPANCTQCSGVSYCTVCIVGFLLYDGSCLSSCPSATYVSIASGSKVCELCQSPCLSCSVFSTYCVSCNPSNSSRYLYTSVNASVCGGGCPPQYYADENYICQSCLAPCLTCSSPVSCSSCVPGYYYYSSAQSCYLACPNTTISLSSPLRCLECTPPCLECSGSINWCTSCVEGYFLDSSLNVCNLTCTLPYFAIDRKCSRCLAPCSTCASLQFSVCLSCLPGYLLLGTTCYSSCPDGSFKTSSSACSICTSGCYTCVNSSSTCLSCYPGLYLYQQMCLPSCPTTPVFYFQYQMQCLVCQPQCTTCISSPVECSSCSDPALYFNEITRQCSSGCVAPYYPGTRQSSPTVKVCIKCSLPCKTCLNSSSECSSCPNGFYLEGTLCVLSCSPSRYADSELNACLPCSLNCLACATGDSCTQCQVGTYFFQGACYLNCPSWAAYTYLQKYCRNCLLDNCLLCDLESQSQSSCLLCEPGYFLYNKKCQSECPQGYEIDSVTQSLCIVSSKSALLIFFARLQKFKVYAMPGTAILIVCAILLWSLLSRLEENGCTGTEFKMQKPSIIKVNVAIMVLGLPQVLSFVCYLVYLILSPEAYHHSEKLNTIYLAIFGFFIALNVVQFFSVTTVLRTDHLMVEWRTRHQKNNRRFLVIMVAALLLNRKLIYLLFSGIWRIPMTCCQVSALTLQVLNKRLKLVCFLAIGLVEVPVIVYTLYTAIVENYLLTNSRIFYATVDIVFLNFTSICVQIAFVAKEFSVPVTYKKYVLEKVSNRQVAALSQKLHEEAEEENDQHLHRSNSAEMIKNESPEMNAVQYKSVFDTHDFQDPQYFEPFKIENALSIGAFRKKNLKRKNKKDRHLELGVISEDSQQSAQKPSDKAKKRGRGKSNKLGYMKNFIYWKPPEKMQNKQPEKQFKMHEKQIMQTIREKQSDFDAITRNDLIFQEQGQNSNSSHDSDPNFEIEDSRRALNFQYQAFLNKNYAKRRHLG